MHSKIYCNKIIIKDKSTYVVPRLGRKQKGPKFRKFDLPKIEMPVMCFMCLVENFSRKKYFRSHENLYIIPINFSKNGCYFCCVAAIISQNFSTNGSHFRSVAAPAPASALGLGRKSVPPAVKNALQTALATAPPAQCPRRASGQRATASALSLLAHTITV
jgi:hypothetical protein